MEYWKEGILVVNDFSRQACYSLKEKKYFHALNKKVFIMTNLRSLLIYALVIKWCKELTYFVSSTIRCTFLNNSSYNYKYKYLFIIIIQIMTLGKVHCQNLEPLNGYKIIYLPYELNNIVNQIESNFKEIGFKVYRNENQLQNDQDFINDRNLVLLCEITHKYSYPHTTIGITLTNTKNSVIFERIENTSKKSFVSFNVEGDREWVVKRIFKDFNNFKYSFNKDLSLTSQLMKNLPEVEHTYETELSLRNYFDAHSLHNIEGIYKPFQNESSGYYKLGVKKRGDKFIAIVIETNQNRVWRVGEVKAYFESTSMNDVFSVRWLLDDKQNYESFAVLQSNAILSIEFIDPETREKSRASFIKIYPSAEDNNRSEKNQKSSGSGFFVSTDGVIATNAHVVENARKVVVNVFNDEGYFSYNAKVLIQDISNDVALLKIEDAEFNGLNDIPYVLDDVADIGEDVFTIGYPLNDIMGKNYKVTNGIISSNTGLDDDVRYYQISVPLQPGNSGGPLFNSDGDVIGLSTARLNVDAIGLEVQNVNYAVKISYLLNLYSMIPNAQKLRTKSGVLNIPLNEQVKVLKNYVCLIEVN